MYILATIWEELSVDPIHCGWALSEADFAPEDDDAYEE
jgi:hypothetical protein